MDMLAQKYLDTCLKIKYQRSAKITSFGEPMNCYGFVYWFYRLVLNKELERDVEKLEDVKLVKYEKVESFLNFDIVEIKSFIENGSHVGIVIKDIFYHFSFEGLQSKHIERIPHLIKGAYRVS